MTLTPTSVSVVNIPASSLSFPNDIYTWFNISPIRQIAPPTLNALRQFNHPFDFGVMFSTYLLYISFCLFLSFSFKTAPIPGSLLFFHSYLTSFLCCRHILCYLQNHSLVHIVTYSIKHSPKSS